MKRTSWSFVLGMFTLAVYLTLTGVKENFSTQNTIILVLVIFVGALINSFFLEKRK
jgi:predicted branched-subunit amino acid permease